MILVAQQYRFQIAKCVEGGMGIDRCAQFLISMVEDATFQRIIEKQLTHTEYFSYNFSGALNSPLKVSSPAINLHIVQIKNKFKQMKT